MLYMSKGDNMLNFIKYVMAAVSGFSKGLISGIWNSDMRYQNVLLWIVLAGGTCALIWGIWKIVTAGLGFIYATLAILGLVFVAPQAIIVILVSAKSLFVKSQTVPKATV